MSYSFNQRKKLIRKRSSFRRDVEAIVKSRLGPGISIEELFYGRR